MRELELPDGATAGDVYAALALGDEPAASPTPSTASTPSAAPTLRDGDEVALLTPVSGGAAEPLVLLGPEPIDLGRLIAHVGGPDAGAIATFTGTVRDSARDREVLDLEYEAYPGMAEQEIARIARAALADHGCLRAAICAPHRRRRRRRGLGRDRDLLGRTAPPPSRPASRRSTRSS